MPFKIRDIVKDGITQYSTVYTQKEYENLEWMLYKVMLLLEVHELTSLHQPVANKAIMESIVGLREWYESYKNRGKE